MAEALGKLTFLPGFRIQVNNRKLIQASTPASAPRTRPR